MLFVGVALVFVDFGTTQRSFCRYVVLCAYELMAVSCFLSCYEGSGK